MDRRYADDDLQGIWFNIVMRSTFYSGEYRDNWSEPRSDEFVQAVKSRLEQRGLSLEVEPVCPCCLPAFPLRLEDGRVRCPNSNFSWELDQTLRQLMVFQAD